MILVCEKIYVPGVFIFRDNQFNFSKHGSRSKGLWCAKTKTLVCSCSRYDIGIVLLVCLLPRRQWIAPMALRPSCRRRPSGWRHTSKPQPDSQREMAHRPRSSGQIELSSVEALCIMLNQGTRGVRQERGSRKTTAVCKKCDGGGHLYRG